MPTLPDVRAIDQAILSVLKNDTILSALMPGGVHWNVAPQGATAFVTIDRQDFEVTYAMGAHDGGIERIGYQIVARARTSAADTPLDAAARIHDLMHMQPLALDGTGYEWMATTRSRPVRFTDREQPSNTEWQTVGGVYDVMVSSELPTVIN